jgi:hypothetical protein
MVLTKAKILIRGGLGLPQLLHDGHLWDLTNPELIGSPPGTSIKMFDTTGMRGKNWPK